jgi:PAS domain S-box-containing protein
MVRKLLQKLSQKLKITRVDVLVLVVSSSACFWFISQTRQAELMARMWQEAAYLGPVPQAIVDGHTHKIMDINPAFEKELGWTKEGAIGNTISFLLTPQSMQNHRGYMSNREIRESLLHTMQVATHCRVRKSPAIGGGEVVAEVSIKGIDTMDSPYRWVVAIANKETVNVVAGDTDGPGAENGS